MKRVFVFSLGICLLFLSVNAKVFIELPCNSVSVQNVRGTAVFNASHCYGAPGQPNLPVNTYSILLPPDADLSAITCVIEGLKEDALAEEFAVEPALPHATITGLLWPQNRSIVDGKDMGVYSLNSVFPKEHIEVLSIGQLHCYNIVSVRVNLFRYNPVTKTLYQLKAGKIVVDAKKEADYSAARSKSILVPEGIRIQAGKCAYNYTEFAASYNSLYSFTPAKKMVIIVSNTTKSNLKKFNDFVASKKARGIDVQVITETEWGGGTGSTCAKNIRTWLQNNYQTSGIQYALLIGSPSTSSGDVPMYSFPSYAGSSSCPSDWPYAQLTGTDYKVDILCEISVGRFPIFSSNYTNCDSILAKTIAYESAKLADIAWRKNALFGAGGYSSSSKGDKLFEAVHTNFILKTPPWKDFRIYGTAYGTPTGTPDITGISTTTFTNQWANNKYGIVDWATHGSATSAQSVFSSSGASQVGNKYPAFVLCGSCSNADISSTTNLSYSVLRYCGMGAIGGTNLTYYNPGSLSNLDSAGSDEGWAYNFAKYMIRDSMEIGDAFNSIRAIDPDFEWENRAPYVLYGDPSVGIITCQDNNVGNTLSSVQGVTGGKLYAYQVSAGGNSMVKIHCALKSNTDGIVTIYSLTGTKITSIPVHNGAKTILWNCTHTGAGIYIASLMQKDATGLPYMMSTRFVIK